MLVLLGVPVSHTINTSEALVRADAWTSIGSYLVLLEVSRAKNLSHKPCGLRLGNSPLIA